MVKHRVKGKTCVIDVDIPAYMDDAMKKVLLELMKRCLDDEHQKEVVDAINHLVESTSVLIAALKKVGENSKDLEKSVRGMVGTHLNHGFEVGKNYALFDIKIAEALMGQKEEYAKMAQSFPKKSGLAVSLFYCINLGRMAYETGFMLGTLISAEKVEKYYSESKKKQAEYIG